MPDQPDTEDRRGAVEAYERARDTGKSRPHRVDLVDERLLDYGTPHRRPILIPTQSAAAASQRVDHGIVDPTSTAFKVGFGLAAGVGVFRLAVLTGLGLLAFVTIIALAQSLAD